MSVEQQVTAHYTTATLTARITEGLAALGCDTAHPRAEDLKPVDEFHTGGIEATEALLDQLDISPATRVLDVGSGLGGTARHVARRYGAKVMGVDLTPAYVEAARELSTMAGLSGATRFREGSATALPVEPESFDLALMFHVGMNLPDKAALFAEVGRALAPGGTFALFDVMRAGEGALSFPLPWSTSEATSFVEAPAVYHAAAEAAGFERVAERDRKDFALHYFERVLATIAEKGLPPLGIHLLMGETARQKMQNYVACVRAGLIAPREMIFRKRA
ncbi:class I SAM-dependent methyltransferase [Oceanicella sp. SM1341]|uniref:class I SAM-dependent methyltransferase n=1 Tax=Oceanicella sp. SM1341 TaxID=1548889 RepID=UPI0013005B99|nr:class I SAM-dependent methyltransferase [Oceanicella sp. SM1341]